MLNMKKKYEGVTYFSKFYRRIQNDIRDTMEFNKEHVPTLNKSKSKPISNLTIELNTSNIVLITQSDYAQTPYITTDPRVSVLDKLNCIKACKYYQKDLSKLSLFLTTGRVTDLDLDIRRVCGI